MDESDPVEEKKLSVKERINLLTATIASSESIAAAASAASAASAGAVAKLKKVERKSMAPKFVTPLVGVMVEPGAPVLMEAIIDGKQSV